MLLNTVTKNNKLKKNTSKPINFFFNKLKQNKIKPPQLHSTKGLYSLLSEIYKLRTITYTV